MSSEMDEITELHVARAVDSLVDEFGDQVPQPAIASFETRWRVSRRAPRSTTSCRRSRTGSPASAYLDLGESFAKPLSDEVLRAADIVVTMGRSVGHVEIPDETRRIDWRVGDPTGADVEEVRVVRDDSDRRVRALVSALLDSST